MWSEQKGYPVSRNVANAFIETSGRLTYLSGTVVFMIYSSDFTTE